MRCPFCGLDQNKVLDSRDSDEGRAVRRRRECESCARRFTTYERAEDTVPWVIKSNGEREAFAREKVLRGVQRACEKRPVSLDALEKLVADVERQLTERGDREVPSALIGELVMRRLQEIDHIAYVRYASVYRDFQDVGDFKKTVDSLEGGGGGTSSGTDEAA